jgi:1-deoxy-D-xylulose-5-phosphate reductoisomerase
MKNIAILGSTGSIGVNALDVLSRMKDDFRVTALSADSNIKLLSAQARRFRPRIVAIGNGLLASQIKKLVPSRTKVVTGTEGLCAIAGASDIDTIVFAISGNACLIPLLEAIRRKKGIALANKEALVSGGPIVMKLARQNRSTASIARYSNAFTEGRKGFSKYILREAEGLCWMSAHQGSTGCRQALS